MIGPLLIGWIKDRTGSYTTALVPLIALALIGFATIFLLPKKDGSKMLGDPVEAK